MGFLPIHRQKQTRNRSNKKTTILSISLNEVYRCHSVLVGACVQLATTMIVKLLLLLFFWWFRVKVFVFIFHDCFWYSPMHGGGELDEWLAGDWSISCEFRCCVLVGKHRCLVFMSNFLFSQVIRHANFIHLLAVVTFL